MLAERRSSPIPDDANLAVAISGLSAPIGKEVIPYGRMVIEASKLDLRNFEISKVAGLLKLVKLDDAEAIDCGQKNAIEIQFEQCATPQKISELLEENKLLLTRYINLYKVDGWQGAVIMNGQLLIDTNRLISAQSKLLIQQQKPSEAFHLLHDNQAFISRLLGQDCTAIEKAIFLLVDGLNLSSMEHLLYQNPEISVKYEQALAALLKPQTLSRYNLKGMMRAEYHFFNDGLLSEFTSNQGVHVEYMRNRFYQDHLVLLKHMQVPANKLSRSQSELAKRYNISSIRTITDAFLPHGASNIIIKLMISGQARSLHLVKSMHAKSATIGLLNLSSKIRQQNISTSDTQAFLSRAGQEYNCPFTTRPVVFDSVNKTIYCEDTEMDERVAEVRL